MARVREVRAGRDVKPAHAALALLVAPAAVLVFLAATATAGASSSSWWRLVAFWGVAAFLVYPLAAVAVLFVEAVRDWRRRYPAASPARPGPAGKVLPFRRRSRGRDTPRR